MKAALEKLKQGGVKQSDRSHSNPDDWMGIVNARKA
jgi:hypothetical protein